MKLAWLSMHSMAEAWTMGPGLGARPRSPSLSYGPEQALRPPWGWGGSERDIWKESSHKETIGGLRGSNFAL
jgi:hypothetical protein